MEADDTPLSPTLRPVAPRAHTSGTSFRVLIAGPRHFTDYPALRAALDALLAKRLPDVVVLTGDGRGVPMLAASYASERGLTVTARVADFVRFPADAVERRAPPEVSRVPVPRNGIPVHVAGGRQPLRERNSRFGPKVTVACDPAPARAY
jgi:hypothetical protein